MSYKRAMVAAPLLHPASLGPGDLVAVVAPSGPIPDDVLDAGLAFLRARYRVWEDPGCRARTGFLAGPDETRRSGLARAVALAEARAVLCARGGVGAMRVLDGLAGLAASPRWLVGFSDVTALHLEAHRLGVASVHGPTVSQLGRPGPGLEATRAGLVAALEGAPVTFPGLGVLSPGGAEGPAFGGNLTLLVAMAAAGRLSVPEGAVLFLEDVGEAPFRVERALVALRLGGHVARASAVVLGGFTDCRTGPDGTTVEDVLARFAEGAGRPVVSGAAFGHGATNVAFRLGAHAVVDAGGAAPSVTIAAGARR